MLYALPTAQLAARVRARHPTADVDTCAAAFWLWKERADKHLDLTQYDLVVVDKVSQLDAEQFDRILQMWEAADKLGLPLINCSYGAIKKSQIGLKCKDLAIWLACH